MDGTQDSNDEQYKRTQQIINSLINEWRYYLMNIIILCINELLFLSDSFS